MMRQFLLLAVLLAPVARAADTANTAVQIKVTCNPNGCKADNSRLSQWPAEIKLNVVGADGKWDCLIRSAGAADTPCDEKTNTELTASTRPVLVLRSEADESKFVQLEIFEPNNQGPAFAAGAAAMLTFVLAMLVVFFGARLVKIRAAERIGISSRTGDFEKSIATIAGTLKFSAPVTTDNDSASSTGGNLEAAIKKFLQYAEDCFKSIGSIPKDGRDRIVEMQTLASQAGRQADHQSVMERYNSLARTLSRLAFLAVEDDANRIGKRNDMADAALKSLLEIIGFRLLVPKPLEKYVAAKHIYSRSERPHSPGHTGYIARVERRGLMDSNDEVIEKPTVVVYG